MARTKYAIDSSHSSVEFVARHMVVAKVRGRFKSFEGVIDLDEGDFTKSQVSVKVDAASIDTAEEKRDGHLRSADFFDVERFPALTFESKRVEKKGDGYAVVGDLTMHGVTREVTLNTSFEGKGKDPWGNQRVAFSATASVNREDFGLNWNQVLEAGGVLVGQKIDIVLEVQAVPKKD
ncbi:MAG TPA: YceI family protein [Polyangiaceae bacterium]|nr:YceI family protein [Polyangiaceae bacterium]